MPGLFSFSKRWRTYLKELRLVLVLFTHFYNAMKALLVLLCLTLGGCSALDFFNFSSHADAEEKEAPINEQQKNTVSGQVHAKEKKLKAPASKKSVKKEKTDDTARAENDKIKKELDEFARHKIILINQGLRPNKNSKEVTKKNGMYVARYMEVHPTSLQTRYRTSKGNPPVQYVGFLEYKETHYEAKGNTKEKALKGPFHVSRVRNMTEIILYDNRGWHD